MDAISLPMSSSGPTSAIALSGGCHSAAGLYIHVPFCFHKCHYCDFYSFVDTHDRQPVFVERLGSELAKLALHGKPTASGGLSSIFVGGGTPSLLAVELWRQLLEVLRERFDFDERTEFTVECNPETVTPGLMAALRAGGVNRVSVGAQSFDARHLGTLERWHEPANVDRALRLAADAGIERRSVDLIFAIPGQTLDDWKRELDTALGLMGGGGVEHLSCYGLTYEPNTAMTARLNRGDFAPADEDLEADMYLHTVARLRDAGLDRYEVSNFARAGAECRHNLAYWRQEQWLAAGPSASAHVGGHRWKNVPRLTDWMQGVERSGGYSPIVDHEPPDDRRARVEYVMTALRLREGVEVGRVERGMDRASTESLRAVLGAQRARGMIESCPGDRWCLTDAGFLHADGVASQIMRAIAG